MSKANQNRRLAAKRRAAAEAKTAAKTAEKKSKAKAKSKDESAKVEHDENKPASWSWMRETVESIVIAFILAFLFRTFEAEAFVIPTGSMAPTLQGRHHDIECPKCDYQYRVGASENRTGNNNPVTGTVCPMCFYPTDILESGDINHRPFTGDRILVNKFSYQFRDPERWDVCVFKFPKNAKINFIKRLVGMPGEDLLINGGDIYVRKNGDDGQAKYQIVRKPPSKMLAMLHLVHDSRYIADEIAELTKAGRWIPRWRSLPPESGWQSEDGGRSFAFSNVSKEMAWLRYHHAPPNEGTWNAIASNSLPTRPKTQLISDFYAYNAGIQSKTPSLVGNHWVGDLVLEADLDVDSEAGEIVLDLVEGGRHHRCTFNVAGGAATLAIDDGAVKFLNEEGNATLAKLKTKTSLRGAGSYRVRFSNVDDELRLWIDGQRVDFGQPAHFRSPQLELPNWTEDNPGDLAPLGIGAKGAQLAVSRLRVLRDVYYIATRSGGSPAADYKSDREDQSLSLAYALESAREYKEDIVAAIKSRRRKVVEFRVGPEEFLPLGDNSPESQDARLWEKSTHSQTDATSGVTRYSNPELVHRRFLIGKAMFIYWPHGWNVRIPIINRVWGIIPNFRRMTFVE